MPKPIETLSIGDRATIQTALGIRPLLPANFADAPLAADEYIGLVAGSCRMPDTYPGTANRWFRSRTAHFTRAAVTKIALVLPNWYWDRSSKIEMPKGASVTYTASIEYPVGVYNQVRFNGQVRGFGRDNEFVVSDFIDLAIPADTQFWVKLWGTSTANILFTLMPQNAGLGEAFFYNTTAVGDQTMTATADGADATLTFTPYAIIGVTSAPAVIVDGDSIVRGDGDTIDAANDTGLCRSVGHEVAYTSNGSTGDSAQRYVDSYLHRTSAAVYAKNVLLNRGVNDIGDGRSLAQLKANKIREWTIWNSLVERVFQTTITPKTTSSDSFATTANQTAATNFSTAGNGTRELFNDWLRDGAPMIDGAAAAIGATTGSVRAGEEGHPLYTIFDVADVVESARNSGKWKVDGTAGKWTSDGIHPTTYAQEQIKASGVIDTSLFV